MIEAAHSKVLEILPLSGQVSSKFQCQAAGSRVRVLGPCALELAARYEAHCVTSVRAKSAVGNVESRRVLATSAIAENNPKQTV